MYCVIGCDAVHQARLHASTLSHACHAEPCTLTEDLVASASGVLRAVCTADDERPPTSKAFPHARVLAHENQVCAWG